MKIFLFLSTVLLVLGGCDAYLDVKPNKAIDTPDSIESVEALLDNASTLNFTSSLLVVLGDEFFADEQAISSMELLEQNFYLWTPRPLQPDELVYDWRNAYNQIQISNVALEALESLPNNSKRDELRGRALFFRSNAYFSLYSLFLDGPNLESAGLKLQIPIRNSTSIIIQPELADKSTIYNVIKSDLEEAAELLPLSVAYLSRPSKQAAYALLARVLLSWEEYEGAKNAAEKVIHLGGELLNYSDLSASSTYPIPSLSSEIIWLGRIGGTSYFNSQSGFQISPDLLGLYSDQDLRKSLFYIMRPSGFINFRGSYLSGRPLFSGLSLNETYLIFAESLVRTGDLKRGEQMINFLLGNRMKAGWEEIKFSDETQALQLILEERRKELPFRGLRWLDLRRINKDDRFKITLRREFQGNKYDLTPNSEKYVLPIPARELSFY